MCCGEEKKVALDQGSKMRIHGERVRKLLTDCAEKHVKAHRSRKEEKAITKEQNFVLEGNERVNELATEEADVDGGQMAATTAFAIKQLRKDVFCVTCVCFAIFMCRLKSGRPEMRLAPKEHFRGSVCTRKKKENTGQCSAMI